MSVILLKSTILSLVFLCYLQFSALAQSQTISGTIWNSHNQPLPGASVILFHQDHSSYVAGASTDSNGNFALKAPQGKYLLSATMTGFKAASLPVSILPGKPVSLDTIFLIAQIHELKEAVISASRNAFEFEAGKMIVHPRASILAAQGSLFELLRNIPGLVVNEDGTIFLNGQKGINVQINGKNAYLSGTALVSLLKSTASASVEKIGILTSPSAEYDASGNAGIIDIRLKKADMQGLVVSSYINYQQGRNGRVDIGIRSAFRNQRAGLCLDYSQFAGDKTKSGTLFRECIRTNLGTQTARQSVALTNQDQTHHLKLSADLDVSKQLSIDAYIGSSLFHRCIPGSSNTLFSSFNSVKDSVLNTSTQSNYKQITVQGGLRATYKIDKRGELNTSVDFLSFRHTESMQMRSCMNRLINNLPFRNDTLSGNLYDRVRVLSAQTDLSIPLSSGFQFQTGVKSVFMNIDNRAIYDYPLNGTIVTNYTYSTIYRYYEHNNAAYVQLKGKFKSWDFQAGARVENTNIKGTTFDLERNSGDSSYRIHYTRFFPSLAILYHFEESQGISVTYNRRITRPNYRDLCPFGYVVDEYIIIRGNSGLQAELTHNFELAFIFKTRFRSSIFYTHTGDVIAQGFRESENGGIYVIPENMASRRSMGLKTDAGDLLNWKRWKLGTSFSLSYTKNKWEEVGLHRISAIVTPALSVNNSFIGGKGWSAQLTAYYNGRIAYGQMEIPHFWSVSGGVRKKIMGDKLSIHMYINDIFASIRERATFSSGAIRGSSDVRYDETSAGLSIHFNFKKGKQKEIIDRTLDESRRINF